MNEYHLHQLQKIIESQDSPITESLTSIGLNVLKGDSSSSNEKLDKLTPVIIELLELCFVANPSVNFRSTVYFVKKVEGLVFKTVGSRKKESHLIAHYLKFYTHSKAGYCGQRRKADSVPYLTLKKLVEEPEQFEENGLVRLVQTCVRGVWRLEHDPLSLMVQLVNSSIERDYAGSKHCDAVALHRYLPLVLVGEICREQRLNYNRCVGEAAHLAGSKYCE